jgi:hypothetical protein
MNSWDFIHKWQMPFIWLAGSAVISIAVAIYFQLGMTMHPGSDVGLGYGTDWVLRDDVLATFVVYALSLGSAVWLLDADGTTRWAAFWALLAAIARIVVPVWLATSSDVALANGQHYLNWDTLRIVLWFSDFQMTASLLMLFAVFSRFAGEARGFGHAHAEAY